MTSVRAAKSKGSQFEYDCQYSLSKKYPDIYRTAERGFQRQYDLHTDAFGGIAFECKRLKGISWNQLVKFHTILSVKSKVPNVFLLFKSNNQPCLVFGEYPEEDVYYIKEFHKVFGVPFEKHPSTRPKKEQVPP